MSWLTARLRYRIQIQKAIQNPNTITSGFDRTYETLLTVYAGMNTTSDYSRYTSYIRGGDTEQKVATHEFIVRYSAIKNLGKSFVSGFSSGFDSIASLNLLKSDYFVFLQDSSNTKGRLFQIINTKRDDERKEWFIFRVREIEEQGTGYAS